MNTRIVAEEKPTPFFVKIKPVVAGKRFIKDEFATGEQLTEIEELPKAYLGEEIKVDWLRFYGDRVWYHFSYHNQSVGWIQKKALVRHYRRLDIMPAKVLDKHQSASARVLKAWNNFLDVSLLDEDFVGVNPLEILTQVQEVKPTARLTDVDSLKLIHHQIQRGQPIILWLSRPKNAENRIMMLTGYTHHHVFLLDPTTNYLLTPTNQALMGKWRGMGAKAIIY